MSEVPPPPPTLEDVCALLAEAAHAEAVDVLLVGGIVRDRLRGVTGKDVDVVVVGGDDGVQARVLSSLARHRGWSRPEVFERFGTAQTRGEGFVVEAVRARAERYDPASRRPEVRPGTLEEDVWRRDLTVNALAQTLDGRVVDVTGRGLPDLRDGILRTPLDPVETFSEDPLRLYRVARFAAQLGFEPAPGLIEAMRATAERTAILSVERVRDEIRRLLVAPHPRRGLELMDEGGLLEQVLPEVVAMHGVEQSGHHLWDVFGHTVRAVELAPADLMTRTAALLHDVGKPPCHARDDRGRHTFHDHAGVGAAMAETILTRLRFPNDEVRDVGTLVRLHLRPIQYDAATHSDAAVRRLIRDAGPLRGRMLDVARADTLASGYPGVAGIDELGERMERLDSGGAVTRLRPPLDGAELQRRSGRGPGPWIGVAHRILLDAVLDGRLAAGDGDAAWRLLSTEHPDVVGDPGAAGAGGRGTTASGSTRAAGEEDPAAAGTDGDAGAAADDPGAQRTDGAGA